MIASHLNSNSFVLQPYESKNHLVVRVKMKMNNEFGREEPPKPLTQPIPMHPKSNRQKADYFGKWNGSWPKRNSPARTVMNWYRFVAVWAVLAPWAATFRKYSILNLFPPSLVLQAFRKQISIFLATKCEFRAISFLFD